MNLGRNKYLGLILLGLAIFAAGFARVGQFTVTAQPKAIHSAHSSKYKDATIAHRLHQNHFKRHRSNLDGCLPVQQDKMISIVTGTYAVAPVQDQHVPTPATPSLRGPPATA